MIFIFRRQNNINFFVAHKSHKFNKLICGYLCHLWEIKICWLFHKFSNVFGESFSELFSVFSILLHILW